MPNETTADQIQLCRDWITIRWLLGHWDEMERLKVKLAVLEGVESHGS